MLRKFAGVFVFAFLSFGAHGADKSDGPFNFEFQELAPGVWAGVRPDSSRFPVMGNTTFVISDAGVVVYDGGGVPAMADQIISKIRSLTTAPVTHVIISHWHGDHNFGIHQFKDAFPNVQFIAHHFTDRAMNSARMNYIEGYPNFVEKNFPAYQDIVDTGVDEDGNQLTEHDIFYFKRMLDDGPAIDVEYNRVKVTPPTIAFQNSLVLNSGGRKIELLSLGAGNTEGDIVMWLPKEKIVATGDLVVLPAPYAFNVPPRAWAATLTRLNALTYATLVPGHGEIQVDKEYVELIIEAATSIADQRDEMLARGVSLEEIERTLDFSGFEERFTKGDPYIKDAYDSFFEGPFRKAAIKELSGEPMVVLEPKTQE